MLYFQKSNFDPKKERDECLLLLMTEGPTEKSIVGYGQLGFVVFLGIDNPNICFLTKIPRVKVFGSQIPNSHIIKRDQD